MVNGFNHTFTPLNALNTNITNDFNNTMTVLSTLSSNVLACCACTYFITQTANGQVNNQPITSPITNPGVYCVTQDLVGTLTIQSSDVTILFNGYTLTAAWLVFRALVTIASLLKVVLL